MKNRFQIRVWEWMEACFGSTISTDKLERNHRFLEEALELVQSCGCSKSEALQLVDYVFARPVGERGQEVGGVRVTLSALCSAQVIDEEEQAEKELARVWTKIEIIRAKQAAKPKHSPLPAEPLTCAPGVADILDEGIRTLTGFLADMRLSYYQKDLFDCVLKAARLALPVEKKVN